MPRDTSLITQYIHHPLNNDYVYQPYAVIAWGVRVFLMYTWLSYGATTPCGGGLQAPAQHWNAWVVLGRVAVSAISSIPLPCTTHDEWNGKVDRVA